MSATTVRKRVRPPKKAPGKVLNRKSPCVCDGGPSPLGCCRRNVRRDCSKKKRRSRRPRPLSPGRLRSAAAQRMHGAGCAARAPISLKSALCLETFGACDRKTAASRTMLRAGLGRPRSAPVPPSRAAPAQARRCRRRTKAAATRSARGAQEVASKVAAPPQRSVLVYCRPCCARARVRSPHWSPRRVSLPVWQARICRRFGSA